MVEAYWQIGKTVHEACGENDRAAYSKQVLKYLSERLTVEFGKGFDESDLRKMRQFYSTFSIRDTLCPELSWSHYRLLMRVQDEKARNFYTEEAAKSGWSVRQLQRQITSECSPVRISRALPQRSKRPCQDQSMKRSSRIPTCWNSSICQRTSISMNPILSKRLSTICKSSCLSLAEAFPLFPGRSISMSKADISTSTSCFIITS